MTEMELDYRAYCNYCPGFCCYRLEGSTLYLDAVDINRLARHFKISDGEARRRFIEGRNTFKVRSDYDQPCPYLHRQDLLAKIFPKVEADLAAGEC